MKPFRYERPASAAAAAALAEHEPQLAYLAGGTNLVDLMRLEVSTPPVLVDVRDLGFGAIEETPSGGLLIGAGATNTAVACDPRVQQRYPVLSQALLNGASPQLRNRATAAGNLLQRTRCAYFQDVTKPCNKRDPGSGCPAVEGEHHNLAILGWSADCVATHPSDMAVAMVLLDAVVQLERDGHRRSVPVEHLYLPPEADPSRDTVVEPGELITGIELPPAGPMRSRYVKARERASFSFALVSVAAAATGPADAPELRLALGGVAHKPWRARRAEEVLREGRADGVLIERAADAELAAARPLRDNAYKVSMARNMIVRTLGDLCQEP